MAGTLEEVKNWPQATRDYLADIQQEMKKVTWPSRKQVQSTTLVVIITVFFFAAYFKLVDLLINASIVRLYTHFAK